MKLGKNLADALESAAVPLDEGTSQKLISTAGVTQLIRLQGAERPRFAFENFRVA